MGENTFELDNIDGTPLTNQQGEYVKVPSKHLIKCDMPELDFDLTTRLPRRLEVQDKADHNRWHRGTLERFGADGRCFIRYDGENERRYVDLTEQIYRWLVPEKEDVREVLNLSRVAETRS